MLFISKTLGNMLFNHGEFGSNHLKNFGWLVFSICDIFSVFAEYLENYNFNEFGVFTLMLSIVQNILPQISTKFVWLVSKRNSI
jgi:hypothetical protein